MYACIHIYIHIYIYMYMSIYINVYDAGPRQARKAPPRVYPIPRVNVNKPTRIP